MHVVRAFLHAYRWAITAAILQLVLLIYSSRLIDPAEYAVYAFSFTVAQTAGIISRSGYAQYVLRRGVRSSSQFALVVQAACLTASAVALLTVCVTACISTLQFGPQLLGLGAVLAVGTGFGAVALTFLAWLRIGNRELRANRIEFGSILCGFVVSGTLLYCGLGVWALALGSAMGSFLQLALAALGSNYWAHRQWRFRLRIGGPSSVVYFIRSVTIQNLAHQVLVSLPLWVGGFVLSPTSYGELARAFQMATMPLDQIVGTTGRVVYPRIARVRSHKPALERAVLSSLLLIGLPSGLLFSLAAAFAPILIPTLLGNAWSGAAILFIGTAMVALVRVVYTIFAMSLEAVGDTRAISRVLIIDYVVATAGFGYISAVYVLGVAATPRVLIACAAAPFVAGLVGVVYIWIKRHGFKPTHVCAILAAIFLICIPGFVAGFMAAPNVDVDRGILSMVSAIGLGAFVGLVTLGTHRLRKASR